MLSKKLSIGEESSILDLIFDNSRNIVEKIMNNRRQVQMARRGIEAEDARATLENRFFNKENGATDSAPKRRAVAGLALAE